LIFDLRRIFGAEIPVQGKLERGLKVGGDPFFIRRIFVDANDQLRRTLKHHLLGDRRMGKSQKKQRKQIAFHMRLLLGPFLWAR
jgi:hypothetical protein